MAQIKLKKLQDLKSKYDNYFDEITQKAQEFTDIELSPIYQPSDGFCFVIDEDRGCAPTIFHVDDFFRIAKKGIKLDFSYLKGIAI